MKLPNEIKPVLPKHEGMRVLEMGYIPMAQIRSSNEGWTNINRPEGPNAEKISMHEKCIKDGKYIPEMHVPPTVEKLSEQDGPILYEVGTGAHRHMSHENTGQTEFYAAVVEFFDTPNGSADYWRAIWQSVENAEDADNTVSKNVRSEAGIINTVLHVMDKGYVTRDEAGIVRALSDQKIDKNSQRGKNLKNKILSMIDENAETVRILSKADAANIERQESTPTVHAIARTMKDQTGIDADYDMRLMLTVLSFLDNKTSKRFMRIFMHWTGLNASQIRASRLTKSTLFDRLAKICRRYLHYYNSGELHRRVDIIFTEQLKTDLENSFCDDEDEAKQAA